MSGFDPLNAILSLRGRIKLVLLNAGVDRALADRLAPNIWHAVCGQGVLVAPLDMAYRAFLAGEQATEAAASPRGKMIQIARDYELGFLFNPGGGEFTHRSGRRCQIGTYDDNEDLEKLEAWIALEGAALREYNSK